MDKIIYGLLLVLYFFILGVQNVKPLLSLPPQIFSESLIRVKNYTLADGMKNKFFVFDSAALIEKQGYFVEEYTICTQDGYKIKIFRIPGNKKKPKAKGKPVVFLQHGQMSSSDSWVVRGKNQDLAFILANKGYDIWLSNVRGNVYGRSHTKLSPDIDEEFWQFSFHEMGVYDLPSAIDFILETTQQKTLIYIGYSLGTSTAFILLSEKPEYNSKIRLVVNLGPAVFMNHVKFSPIAKFMQENGDRLMKILSTMGIRELMPQSILNLVAAELCFGEQSVLQSICLAFLFQWIGKTEHYNRTIWFEALKATPSGVSTQCLHHYGQIILKKSFAPYDYGNKQLNIAKYNKSKPSAYNFKNVVSPVALFYSTGDAFTSIQDVEDLEKALPNIVLSERVSFDEKAFNHYDFILADNIKILLNDRIVRFILKYT